MELVYKSSSLPALFASALIRFSALAALLFIHPYYHENTRLITVAEVILVLIFFMSGNTETLIYKDRIVQKSTSFLSWLLQRKGTSYNMKEIKKAALPQRAKPTLEEVGVVMLLSNLLPGNKRIRIDKKEFILLEMKNGKTIEFYPATSESERAKIAGIINSLVTPLAPWEK